MAAYEGYEQNEVITGHEAWQRVQSAVGLSYGYGTPHRQRFQQINEASAVSPNLHEWWVPVKFPSSDYICKVNTGARVNVLSLADISRLGDQLSDLSPSSICLVGFNMAVVRLLGVLCVRVCVNGTFFYTEFQVVEQCNSPLLCLHDASCAGLVNIAASAVPHKVSESSTPGCYCHEIVSLKLTPDAKPKQFPRRKVPLALQKQARVQLDKMLRDGVIERVTEPSPWCHPMQIAHKPDGRLCICMDPR